MIDKLHALYPELLLFAVACIVMVVGLSKSVSIRRGCGWLTGLALLAAGILAYTTTPDAPGAMPNLPMYAKLITCFIGILLILLMQGLADREYDAKTQAGTDIWDPIRSVRGEYYALFLFSLIGVMLCAGADNLIFLFLALELTSLPTYVMIAIANSKERSLESSVKYFYLGALGAATFLFGFAFIYGGTGTTDLNQIGAVLASQAAGGGINPIALTGLAIAVIGLCFKIAAVPMHFYTADVYQGASSSIAAMLAFVPKAAGFFALILLLGTCGWGITGHAALPSPLGELLTIIAILTMTIGNVMALLQTSVKRILAYSSIAHSGYMLVGLIAGPGLPKTNSQLAELSSNGLAAVLAYLLAYGVTSVGTFAVLACLEKKSKNGQTEEADDLADIKGLRATRPMLAWIMFFSALGLMGFPPLLGFFAKLPLFSSAWSAGQGILLLILALNSAIAAFYYLRLASWTMLETPDAAGHAASFRQVPFGGRMLAGSVAVGAIFLLVLFPVTSLARKAGEYSPRWKTGVTASTQTSVPAQSPGQVVVK